MVTVHEEKGLFPFLSRLLSRESMRPVVRIFTHLHVNLYRWTGGRAQVAKYPTMLLTTKGRKTGKLRTVPVVYVKHGENYIIAAAYSGSDKNPTWWLNLQHSKEAIIEENRNKVKVSAELAPAESRERYWDALVKMYPYFTGYQARTQRQIPIVVLKPVAVDQR
jgi:deazaflavin-dependent oxidoreductase (nitroreductase family)